MGSQLAARQPPGGRIARAAAFSLALLLAASVSACEDAGPGYAGGNGDTGAATLAPDVTPTLDDLLTSLADGIDAQERAGAAEALGDLGDTASVAPLISALDDSDELVRTAAAEALGRIGDDQAALPLARLMASATGEERSTASSAIAALHGAGPVLAAAARSGDQEQRLAAVDGLAALGTAGVSGLVGALKDTDARVRSAAANRLGRIGDRRAEKSLAGLLRDAAMGRTASIALARMYRGEGTSLLHYLTASATVGMYYGLLRLGEDDTVAGLTRALQRFGTEEIAEDYLNCGNDDLEHAAEQWASDHGYEVISMPGAAGGSWGAGFDD